MEECYNCGFWNSDYEDCTCPHYDKWYACPIENKKPESKKEIEEYVKWLGEKEKEEMLSKQKELNNVRQELLSRPDQYITFKDLVERFDRIDEEYGHSPWTLLQIYSNFNILIGKDDIAEYNRGYNDGFEGGIKDTEPSTLEKIRAEIKAEEDKAYELYGHALGYDRISAYHKCLKIIDSYMMEGKEK